MPKPNKQVIIDETIKLIAKGESTEKIISAICRKFHFTERTGFNYLKSATKQHTEAQGLINKAKAEDNTIKAINDEIAHKFDVLKKTEFCVGIITGEITVKKVIGYEWVTDANTGKKTIQLIKIDDEPNHNDRLKALAELNKMEGEYAPTKLDVKEKHYVINIDPEIYSNLEHDCNDSVPQDK